LVLGGSHKIHLDIEPTPFVNFTEGQKVWNLAFDALRLQYKEIYI